MKRVLIYSLLAVAAALSIVSCSRYSLRSSAVLNNADLATYKSFSLQPLDKEKVPEGVRVEDVQVLYMVVGDQLEKRGYKKLPSGGEFTVYLSLSFEQSVETDTNVVGTGGLYGGYGGYWGGRYAPMGPVPYAHGVYGATTSSTSELVTDGVLMMDLVENSSNKHIFCSQISARVDGKNLVLKDNEELSKAIAKLFKKFPVEMTGSK